MVNGVELAINQYGNRGHTATLDSLYGVARGHRGSPVWRSYFSFDQEGINYIKQTKTMNKGFVGKCYIDRIVLDYEIEGDKKGGDDVVKEMRYIIKHLNTNLDVPFEQMQLWFSGRRGFHLHLPNLFNIQPDPNADSQLKESVINMLAHPLLDTSMIFKAGMIRLGNTVHKQTGLYKTPFLTQELFQYDFSTIKKVAENPEVSRKDFRFPVVKSIPLIWKKYRKTPRTITTPRLNKNAFTFSPKKIYACMQELTKRGPVTGRRHTDILRLSSWLFRIGVPKEWATEAMIDWTSTEPLSQNEKESLTKTVSQVYQKGYLYSCKDSVMNEFCDPQCIYYMKKSTNPQVETATELAKKYQTFLSQLQNEGTGFDLMKIFPSKYKKKQTPYWILPEEVMMITGDTGMMKSAFAQNIINNAKQSCLWLNLEMANHLNFRRFMQINSGKTKEEIARLAINNDPEYTRIVNNLDYINQVTIAPTLKNIEGMVLDYNPKIVVIDTTDAVDVPEAGTNELLQLKLVMEGIHELGGRYGCIFICIHHITKSGSRETTRGVKTREGYEKRSIELNDLSGHRSAITKVDHVFVIDGDSKESPQRTVRSLKTRDGGSIKQYMLVDFRTMRFSNVTT